jgi:hypothetical protein
MAATGWATALKTNWTEESAGGVELKLTRQWLTTDQGGSSGASTCSMDDIACCVVGWILRCWGCGPPVQALLACHGFWVVNMAALFWVNHAWLPLHWERRLANLGLMIALVGFAAVAGHTMLFWYPHAADTVRPYVVQRYLFSIATLVDAPLVQLTVFGIAGRWLARRRAASERTLQRVCSAVEDSRTMTAAAHRDEVAVG